MNFWVGLATWCLLVTSIIQYTVYENWQAAMYFLVFAGFYAVYHAAKNAVSYTNCNFVFSEENKEEKQE